jgi:hypothetical protein
VAGGLIAPPSPWIYLPPILSLNLRHSHSIPLHLQVPTILTPTVAHSPPEPSSPPKPRTPRLPASVQLPPILPQTQTDSHILSTTTNTTHRIRYTNRNRCLNKPVASPRNGVKHSAGLLSFLIPLQTAQICSAPTQYTASPLVTTSSSQADRIL